MSSLPVYPSRQCQNCDCRYDTAARTPYIAHPCGHSFCQKCINMFFATDNLCPIDGESIVRSGINFQLKDALAEVAEQAVASFRAERGQRKARNQLETALGGGVKQPKVFQPMPRSMMPPVVIDLEGDRRRAFYARAHELEKLFRPNTQALNEEDLKKNAENPNLPKVWKPEHFPRVDIPEAKLIELAARNISSRHELGIVYACSGRYAQAVQVLLEVGESRNTSGGMRDQTQIYLGISLAFCGKNEEAAERLSGQVDLIVDDPNAVIQDWELTADRSWARLHLAIVLLKLNRYQEALEHFGKAMNDTNLSLGHRDPAQLGYAIALAHLNRHDEAIEALNNYIHAPMLSPYCKDRASLELGRVYSNCGRNDEAIEILTDLLGRDYANLNEDELAQARLYLEAAQQPQKSSGCVIS